METTNRDKLEVLNVAIQKLLDNRRNGLSVDEDEDEDEDEDVRNLLSQLLSQVESLKGNVSVGSPGSPPSTDEIRSVADDVKDGDAPRTGVTADEIVKELRHVKRQNTITHWLLSIMIVVTVAWQLSEVSLILKVKQNLSNPFRSVGNLVTGFFKGKGLAAADGNADEDKSHPTEQDKNGILAMIHPIKIPELPLIDLTKFPLNDDED